MEPPIFDSGTPNFDSGTPNFETFRTHAQKMYVLKGDENIIVKHPIKDTLKEDKPPNK